MRIREESSNVPSYDPEREKFQAATSARQPTGVAIWLAVAGVGLVAGEATYQAATGAGAGTLGWAWLAATALLAFAVAVAAYRSDSHSGRPVALGLGCLTLLMTIAAWRSREVRTNPDTVIKRAVAAAGADRDQVLASAVAAAAHVARNALARTEGVVPGEAPDLADLLEGGPIEMGLVVLASDTIVAVAGPQRIEPIPVAVPVAVVRTPFARVMVVSARRAGRTAEVMLLLDATAALPAPGPTLASRSGDWQRVSWRWTSGADRSDFAGVEQAKAMIGQSMVVVAPSVESLAAREARLARWLAVAGLAVLAVMVIASGAPAIARAVAILIPVWVVVRGGSVAAAYGGPAAYAIVAAVALTLLAVVLWQRPARRTPVGLVAAVMLLAMAPPLVARAGLDIAPPAEPGSPWTWFAWQAVLALATVAYLAIASAPLRSGGEDGADWRRGALATVLAVVVGVVGIEAWQPANPTGLGLTMRWAPWFLPLLLLVLGAMLPVTTARARRLAIATTASVLAALSVWGASLERQQALARQDLDRLGARADAEASAALELMGDAAVAEHATRLDRLYAVWRSSPLATTRAPVQMAIWRDTVVTESVALDQLMPSWGDLQSIVAAGRGTRRVVSLARDPGRYQILVLPFPDAGDTVATVLIGPRSRLVQPTAFGRLVGWRTPANAAYQLEKVVAERARPDLTFRRTGRFVRADREVSAGDLPIVVRATIAMSPPRAFAVRAALTVLLDVLLALSAWWLLERILGFVHTSGREMFRRSYRRTVTWALISFFVVPAAFFTLWSALRLRQEVTRERGEEVTRALRDINGDAQFTAELLAEPRSPMLAQIADRAGAELGVYRRGRLVAASTPLLGELGLFSPVIDPALARGEVAEGRSLAAPVPGANVRLGGEPTAVPQTVVAAALPGADVQLARDQVDLALLLLLASLGGTLAAVAVAGAVARALAQPIEALRRRALAIGRREPAPALREPPLEFEPVFGAITQMERDLQQSEARLEEETARTARIVAWGEMARQVAHEIKNPLTPMRLGLQHLRRLGADARPDLAEQTAITAQRLLGEIDRLDRIARSFARYGSPPEREAGPLEALDLAGICREVAQLYALAAVEPIVEVEERDGSAVLARHEELLQVLLNLLDNARQAGARRVSLQVSGAALAIADDGGGIPADQLGRIFEPTFSTTTSGTGLGLAIVRRLVEGWAGEVFVTSAPGEGTTFTIRFRPAGSTPDAEPA